MSYPNHESFVTGYFHHLICSTPWMNGWAYKQGVPKLPLAKSCLLYINDIHFHIAFKNIFLLRKEVLEKEQEACATHDTAAKLGVRKEDSVFTKKCQTFKGCFVNKVTFC